ncbi:MAG: aquaporin family protein [Flavobacteriales bacterium]|nr:aquaporin family protein [Flavobacteriales bacterium]
MYRVWRECLGELIGTYILVFIGCAAVGMAAVLGWLSSLWQVAGIWGIGVTLAIMASQKLCPAHLNPAVTLAMCLAKGHSWRRLIPYSLAQLIGASLAALTLILIFSDAIDEGEKRLLGTDSDIYQFVGPLRGIESAQMFGEFFPNPGYDHLLEINWMQAMGLEALGAFLLVLFILMITDHIHRLDWNIAGQIGLVVALIICIIAPFTQCGINPARDLGPRLVAYLHGWNETAFPSPVHSAITVYVLGPLIGAFIASIIWRSGRPKMH